MEKLPVTVVAGHATSRLGIISVLSRFCTITTHRTIPDPVTGVMLIVHNDALTDPVTDLAHVPVPVVVITANVDAWWLNQLADANVAGVVADTGDLTELADVVGHVTSHPADDVPLLDSTIREATAAAHWGRSRRVRQRITPAQREIAQLLVQGFTDEQIAAATHKARDTVREQVSALYRTLMIDDVPGNKRVLAVTRLLALGVVPPVWCP